MIKLEVEPFVYDKPEGWKHFKKGMLKLWASKGFLYLIQKDVIGKGPPISADAPLSEEAAKRNQATWQTAYAALNASDKETMDENLMEDASAQLILMRHLCPISKGVIGECDTTYQAWQLLVQSVEQRVSAATVDLARKMDDTKLNDFESMLQYLEEMTNIRNRLALGSHNMTNQDFVQKVIAGLPDEGYQVQKEQVLTSVDLGNEVPFSLLRGMLINAERRGKPKAKGFSKSKKNVEKVSDSETIQALTAKVKKLEQQRHGGGRQRVCYQWTNKGTCNFGDKCRFLHQSGNTDTVQPQRGFRRTPWRKPEEQAFSVRIANEVAAAVHKVLGDQEEKYLTKDYISMDE